MLSGLKKLGQTASNSTRRLTNKARGITPEQRNRMTLQKAAENKMLAKSLATSAPLIAAAKAQEAATEFNRTHTNITAAAKKRAEENAVKAGAPVKSWRNYLPSTPKFGLPKFLTKSNSKTRNYNCKCTKKNTPDLSDQNRGRITALGGGKRNYTTARRTKRKHGTRRN